MESEGLLAADFKHSSTYSTDLCSSGTSRGKCWYIVTDVSGKAYRTFRDKHIGRLGKKHIGPFSRVNTPRPAANVTEKADRRS